MDKIWTNPDHIHSKKMLGC